MVEAVEVRTTAGLWDYLCVSGNTVETPIWRGRKGGGLADRRCQEHAGLGPRWPLF